MDSWPLNDSFRVPDHYEIYDDSWDNNFSIMRVTDTGRSFHHYHESYEYILFVKYFS